jgi:hypothetical protein
MATKQKQTPRTPDAWKSIRARISPSLSKTQLRYIAVHLDVAARMQDKWLEPKIEEQREAFFIYEGWDWADNRPGDAVLSRNPEEVKRARARLKKSAEWCRNYDSERSAKNAKLDAERKRARHRFGL